MELKTEDIGMEKREENDDKENNSNINLKTEEEKLLADYGYVTKINGEIINPEEVSILVGDDMTREITQIMHFLCENYPIEAISYCLTRCFYSTFSKTSLLDKTIKYLLTKYKDSEDIINDLLLAYEDNKLLPKITNFKTFQNLRDEDNRQLTKLVFYDPSAEGVEVKRLTFNEIFVEIDEIYIEQDDIEEKEINEDNIISLEETEEQKSFLGDKHHLFKRFCRRNNNIFVYDFIGFKNEKIKKKTRIGKKHKKEEKEYDSSSAIFVCEQEGCAAKYKYSFYSNKFTEVICHTNCEHKINQNQNLPSYYEQNINLLKEKKHITDVQLVRKGKDSLK